MGWNKTKVCVLTPRAQNGFCITGIRKSWLGMGRCLKGDWTTSMDLVRNSYSTSVRWTHMCVCYTQPHLLQRQWINKQCQTKHPLRIHHFLSSSNKISRHHSLEKIKAATYTLCFFTFVLSAIWATTTQVLHGMVSELGFIGTTKCSCTYLAFPWGRHRLWGHAAMVSLHPAPFQTHPETPPCWQSSPGSQPNTHKPVLVPV